MIYAQASLSRRSALTTLVVLLWIGLLDAPTSLANHVVMHGGPFMGVVVSIAVDPHDPSAVYVASFGGGVFHSRDGGKNWSALNDGLPHRQMLSIAVDPRQPGALYAGGDSGLFKFTNQQSTWRAVDAALAARNIRAIQIDPEHGERIYVATDQGVMEGRSGQWRGLPDGMIATDVRALALTRDGALYAGTFGGIYRKAADAKGWTKLNNGLSDVKVRGMAVDPKNPQIIYAGTATGGTFKSIDGGRNWAPANKGLLNSTVLALVAGSDKTSTLYAATIDGVFRSRDGGARWHATDETLSFTVPTLAIDPSNPSTVYAGSGGHFFKTINGGVKWQEVSHHYVHHFGAKLNAAKR